MSTEKSDNMDTCDDNKVVRPKLELSTLLKLAGATKDVLTFKEVMFYLGQYIIQKQLYDKKQQHIVHCAQDALGRILGVDTFSVKEPRLFFAMLAKNLVIVRSQESIQSSAEAASGSQTPQQQPTQENAVGGSSSSPSMRRHRRRRNRSSRSNDAGPSHRLPGEEKDAGSDEDDGEGSKRSRSDSYSLTFDDSLSWCVIGGLGSGRNKHNSQSSESTSASSAAAAADSDDDNFSVEFEVESIDSDDYDEDDASLSADDQVYEFTVLENDDDDSFDEDTEITEADYWRCNGCDELNPPLPRNCLRCWSLRQDWLCASATHPATCADAPGQLGDCRHLSSNIERCANAPSPACLPACLHGLFRRRRRRGRSGRQNGQILVGSRLAGGDVATVLVLQLVLAGEVVDVRLAAFVRRQLPGDGGQLPGDGDERARAGAHRVGRHAAARLVPGAVPHLPVAAQERLHRPRQDGPPDVVLRVRAQAEEAQQTVSRVPPAHPGRGPHLPQLRWLLASQSG
ncbi:E3 ubiquitin-protein ligase Mdm2 isoform X1 [Syngnathus scovelli]|uniref:E3 ubiquitin-protein ligase Mdm2 isoform X1 n=1 Tax=Syngnathus scovelli TaxID=161590 RepID=UPI00210FABB6|nr:E3 ubiquitin-protein ligase Mdm2 isoform X1 [Syngnathus scovelli]XP_049616410.1 E3 ubiquitin-protein ligase Mdm2 isoform X1 [Syngnathus scovelli]